ncbi:MAG: PQQ-binding-like beta-propeller repeat protein, partial [Phycisphaerae bacterium]|nr:PQQ-binding-like beta-propeller repeat protein [Phycisphaerae bacterium]
VMEDTGYAAPTMVTDGLRVYAIFANGDLICFDFDGNRLWAKNPGLPDNTYGHATSLAMWRNLLLVKIDQREFERDKSKIIALDSLTGREVWSKRRPVPDSWSSPIVINAAGRDQIITCGNPWVISYNPADGAELWRARCLDGEVAPCPIYAGGFLFAVNTGADLSAIRPDGAGDVTKTHIAWKAIDGLPDICSPVSDGKLLWLVETYGILTCYDVKTGKTVGEKELDDDFNASPTLVGERVYLISIEGVTIIIEAAGKYKEIARNELGEKVYASPAFMDGRIYIRGEKNLFCISNEKR